jgi:putative transposase
MNCVRCGSDAVTDRPEVTAQGYLRFRCRDCGRQFNERSGGVLNRTSLPSDMIAFVVFCRLRYRLTLRDLSEILLLRGIEVSHEAVRDWERSCCRSWAKNSANADTGSGVALVPAGTWTRPI